ncbi:MAG: hypothetical protein ACFFBD_16965, partial [Candidatus Hodarchaeota archaeon]
MSKTIYNIYQQHICMVPKRVKLGNGWRVYRKVEAKEGLGKLMPAMPGYIVRPGDICERNGQYFRLSKKGLKPISPAKGRALTNTKIDQQQPKKWLSNPFEVKNIQMRLEALRLIKKQCRKYSLLSIEDGKIKVATETLTYYIDIDTAEVKNRSGYRVRELEQIRYPQWSRIPIFRIGNFPSIQHESLAKALELVRRLEEYDHRVAESQSIKSKNRALSLVKNQCEKHSALRLLKDQIEVTSKSGKRYYVDLKTSQVRNERGKYVCVVTPQS